ncbi:MAG: hypothetical protein ABSA32_04825 [Candidatus Acidiferrales bacterium]|jgi:tetratricopeptide (TPR) repeat protein
MKRNWNQGEAGLACALLLLCAAGVAARPAQTQSQPSATPAQQAAPAPTLAEYNAEQAAATDTDPQQRIKDLDDFVAKFPNSTYMPYVYSVYYKTYNQLKNYPKVIEYADREVALGNKVDAGTRFQALYLRTLAFNYSFSEKDPNAKDEATQELQAAQAGLAVLDQVPKPANQTDDQWAQNKKGPTTLFNYTAGMASIALKDYPSAVTFFKAALAATPNDSATYFHLGVAYLQMSPPQSLDGFWSLARAVALKGPGQSQVQAYLTSQIQNYQGGSVCDNLVTDQVNELITLAGTTTDRPATYMLPSAADLTKAQQDTTNFIPWLKEGGDHGKLMWLATCGSVFPNVAVEVLEVVPGDGDNSTLNVYRPAASDPDAAEKEMEAATEPNMAVHVVGQPEVRKLQKGDGVRFTGTLNGYTQTPFLLTWDNAKVNAEDIPTEKAAPGAHHPAHKPAAPPSH